MRKPCSEALKLGNSLVDPFGPLAGQTRPVLARGNMVGRKLGEFQADFLKSQPDPLREDNEGDAAQRRSGIAAMPRAGAYRRNQPTIFVEPQSRGLNAAASGNFADGEDGIHAPTMHIFALDFKFTLTCRGEQPNRREATMQKDRQSEKLRVAVTGGTSGLGLALVRTLAARGARVAFVARSAHSVEQVASQTGACGIVGDIGRQDDIYPTAMQITGNLGGLDALINNASALGPTPLALLADTQCEDLERALSVNLLGPFRLTSALLGALTASARAGRGAAVVNISSDAAVAAYPGWGAYGASKAALKHMTAIWDQEMRPSGVCFLSIDPGDMDTPLHALAVPDADPTTLKRPDHAAAEIVEALLAALPHQATQQDAVVP